MEKEKRSLFFRLIFYILCLAAVFHVLRDALPPVVLLLLLLVLASRIVLVLLVLRRSPKLDEPGKRDRKKL